MIVDIDNKKYRMLNPIVESDKQAVAFEKALLETFKKIFWFPLIAEWRAVEKSITKKKILVNSLENGSLIKQALENGTISFTGRGFIGKFNAALSREIESLSGIYNKKEKIYVINFFSLPSDIRTIIKDIEAKKKQVLTVLDNFAASKTVDKLLESESFGIFYKNLVQDAESQFQQTVIDPLGIKGFRNQPINDILLREYTANLETYIKNFTDEQVKAIREHVLEKTLQGGRLEELTEFLQERYQITERKAKELAKSEARLAVSTHRKARYQDADIDYYMWSKTPDNKVRPSHQERDGKIYRFGEGIDPGMEYGCRCIARPIVPLE
jgi:SPP1 gp7 family putative phage head morphogenesis protein